MSPEYQSVRNRLKELRTETRLIRLADFDQLGLSGNDIAYCIDQFESERIVKREVHDHKTSEDSSGVDEIVIRITPDGREALKR